MVVSWIDVNMTFWDQDDGWVVSCIIGVKIITRYFFLKVKDSLKQSGPYDILKTAFIQKDDINPFFWNPNDRYKYIHPSRSEIHNRGEVTLIYRGFFYIFYISPLCFTLT